jgi:serine/threonine-protein kinase
LPVPGAPTLRPSLAWGPDGHFIAQTGFGAGLAVIAAESGELEPLTHVDSSRGERHHRFPEFLPGARHVLFTILSGINSEKQQIAVVTLDGGEVKLLTRGRDAYFISTGHLVFLRGNTVMVAPFDPVRLEVTGEATVAIAAIGDNNNLAAGGPYAVSSGGSIAYLAPDPVARGGKELVWVDRAGNAELISQERRAFFMPRLSPDGGRLSLSIREEDSLGMWTYDLVRGTLTLLVGEGSNGYGVWSPDGTAMAFTSDRDGAVNVYRRSGAAQSEDERLADHPDTTLVGSWSPDGTALLVTVVSPETLGDIAVIRPDTGNGVEILLDGPSDEYSPQFSPNGEWFAYSSDESGEQAVYVLSYPDLETRHLVDTSGSKNGEPLWSPDGRELFYRHDDNFMVVSVDYEPDLQLGIPEKLFDWRYRGDLEGITGHDISADGTRFVMVRPAIDATTAQQPRQINVVLNWFEELKQRVPTGGQR